MGPPPAAAPPNSPIAMDPSPVAAVQHTVEFVSLLCQPVNLPAPSPGIRVTLIPRIPQVQQNFRILLPICSAGIGMLRCSDPQLPLTRQFAGANRSVGHCEGVAGR